MNNNVLEAECQKQVQEYINAKARATVPELSTRFAVSEATIRRDLEALDLLSFIQRTHGGAVKIAQTPKEPPMMQRMEENKHAKVRIGKAAVSLINDGNTLFLGSGTTVIEVFHHSPTDINLTVITNSLSVVNELGSHSGVELIVIGGMLRKK